MFKFRKKKNKNKDSQALGGLDFLSIFMRTLKLLSDFIYVVIILVMMLGAGLGLGYLASQIDSVKVPSKETLVKQVSSVTLVSQMTYADGSLISDVDTDLLRTPVESSAISQNIKNAIISTEDENFESHDGVVPKAVFRALLTSVGGVGETSGGSTLTQQLLKQQILGDDPTFKRKAKEIIYALALERYMSKDEILTAYLNVSPFGRNNKGQNIAGVEEAAQGIFGVSAKDLTIPQAAFIAGLPQSPIVYSPYNSDGSLKDADDLSYGVSRQKDVLYNMYRSGYISKEEYENYKAYDITQDFLSSGVAETTSHDYLYYSVFDEAKDLMYDYLIKRDGVSDQDLKNDETKQAYQDLAEEALKTGGYTVKTTINSTVYNAMQTAAATYGSLLDDSTGEVQMGNVLMDNSTGAILGFVGGRDYNENQNNHAFNSYRSPGSSIKPILAYSVAIDQGLMGSASILSNYPTTFSSGEKIMHDTSEGTAMITLQEALNSSWNIPAYWTYQKLLSEGVDVESYMSKMGYLIDNYNIESLPLGGGIDVSVFQQTNAYQTLANGGVYNEGYMVDSIVDSDGTVIYQHEANPVRVYSAATASIMEELLRGVIKSGTTTSFKSVLTGLNSTLGNADWVGKTGTSNNYVDSWLVVSTPNVTLGSWAGHDDSSAMSTSSGTNNNKYIANLVNMIYQAAPEVIGTSDKFTLDSSVIKSDVLVSTGLKPATVSINGSNVSVSGTTTTSYWAKNGAGNTVYKFAIGGSDSDYQDAWQKILSGK
ncbi:penicillin-binding protein PBP1B [Streptococcus loxodontisalivarius]|uniref:Penicillin-binding protein n=1 Tax=Streptococcus loxodontisalivarius TaxID=1349415 RepID=A0ABS2PVA0_9STRE|nr:penicillin-binding protein PBP1B [Streptococcus loxodontisalivarius]MBM7643384.1 penicillin-binding protein [Streptococcus loxodontisalivarius]